jgi:hypothetical protein
LISFAFFTTPTAKTQECPPCMKDQEPMQGGCCDTCSDGSGRRVIKVQIKFSGTGSWSDQPDGGTNPAIWNGVSGAIQIWNNATDPSGHKTNYCFKLDQNTSSPDVVVNKGNVPTGTCGATSKTGPPYTMILPSW